MDTKEFHPDVSIDEAANELDISEEIEEVLGLGPMKLNPFAHQGHAILRRSGFTSYKNVGVFSDSSDE